MSTLVRATASGKTPWEYEPPGRLYLPDSVTAGRRVIGNRVRAQTTVNVQGNKVKLQGGIERTNHGFLNGRQVISFGDPRLHPEKAAFTMVLPDPNDPTSRVMMLLGGGIEWTGDQLELADRALSDRKSREEDRKSDLPNRQEEWRDKVARALDRRMDKHRRNPVTDPAPNYINKPRAERGLSPQYQVKFDNERTTSSGLITAKR